MSKIFLQKNIKKLIVKIQQLKHHKKDNKQFDHLIVYQKVIFQLK